MTLDPSHVRARKMVRLLSFVAALMAALALGSIALDRFGLSEPRLHARDAVEWMLSHGVNIVIIIVGAAVVIRAASLAVERMQQTLGERHLQTDLEWQRRASTISGILTNLVTVAVAFVAMMMLLRELSIDVLPILTGAGIAGLAVGFGAQNLVRDVISGFFLILEDQVRVGDIARINGVSGLVEQINLRTIVLRDEEGAVQVFPNGTITALANLSKRFAYAIVEVHVAYKENVDRAIGTLREIGAAMERDPTWGSMVLAPLEVQGVDSLADTYAVVKVRFRTHPLNQGKVAAELRRRVMTLFVARGIRPYAG
jgi:small conductance mechanosensitive channel